MENFDDELEDLDYIDDEDSSYNSYNYTYDDDDYSYDDDDYSYDDEDDEDVEYEEY
ncbi:hypothetical protein LMG7974_01130 [Campylobacter majalis]|uniref:Highly acidic protein n=1 Tax=Campylobacter majalis TaxID=2790656 RepID=A0ABM8Q706_9BACT|nr:hypothetical protein [Campylobacter majalis]CAD7288742.1 hypothetical protein LMG7974_01130 [Campylobacter majalis]